MKKQKNPTPRARIIRKSPEVRTQEIIDCARTILATEGYIALSFRSIAAAVGVRMSTVQHYFPTIASLYIAVIGKSMDQWHANLKRVTSQTSLSVEERLVEASQLTISDILDSATVRIMTELYAVSLRDEEARRVLRTEYGAYRELFVDMFREVRPDLGRATLTTFATLYITHLDGLLIVLDRSEAGTRNEALLRELARPVVHGYLFALKSLPVEKLRPTKRR